MLKQFFIIVFTSRYYAGWNTCWSLLPFLDSLSASSLSGTSQWDGIHWRIKFVLFVKACSSLLIVSIICSPRYVWMLWSRDLQSVRKTMFGDRLSFAFRSWAALSSADASALKLVERYPVEMDLDVELPSMHLIKTPPPPFLLLLFVWITLIFVLKSTLGSNTLSWVYTSADCVRLRVSRFC